MTQEEKQLLLIDLCARLPYGVMCHYETEVPIIMEVFRGDGVLQSILGVGKACIINGQHRKINELKPYLRPMSSMTEEESKEFQAFHCIDELHPYFYQQMCNIRNESNMFDWLNSHHFDFRNLIERGLAIDCTNLNIY